MESNARGTRWQLSWNLRIPGFGLDTEAEVAFYLPGVTLGVCAAVNRIMTGSVAMGTTTDTETSMPPTWNGSLHEIFGVFPLDEVARLPLRSSKVFRTTFLKDLTFTNPTAAAAVGCFRSTSSDTPINVVYAVAQAN
jgi:hypothetical protein